MQHQRQALAWMQGVNKSRAVLWWYPRRRDGSGQTASAVGDSLRYGGPPAAFIAAGPSLIVCPTSVVDSWETELYSRFDPALDLSF